MLYIDEVLMLTIGLLVFIMIYFNLERFKKIPHYKILFSSFSVVLLAWIFTVIEGLILPVVINILEHICYMVSSFLLMYWVIKISKTKRA